MIKQELRLFFTALQFYTRIPCGRWLAPGNRQLSEATRYLPVVGWITGLASGAVLAGAGQLFPVPLAVALSMAASVLLTGAFHEDGLADFCNGFGGGWTKERILEIMKDSRTGTYGVVGLVLLLLIRFLALSQVVEMVGAQAVPLLLLLATAHAVSRFTAASFIFTHNYAQMENSKAAAAARPTQKSTALLCTLFAMLPLFVTVLVTHRPGLLVLAPVLGLLRVYLGRYFNKWIGGYTGDCLGAAQQLSEVAIYLTCIVLWKFS